jgi:hypothetical protein
MPAGFDAACRMTEFYVAFGRVKRLVAVFQANEKFHLSSAYRCDSLDRQIGALVYDLYLPAPRLRPAGALTPAEIKIVEGV